MKVECPNCAEEFEVRGKSPLGSGTQDAKRAKKLGKNHLTLLKVFLDKIRIWRPMTAREIRNILYNLEIRRTTREGIKVNWDYLAVFRALSFLVGADILMLTNDPKIWLENPETRDWDIDKKPRYWPVNENRIKALLEHQGRILYVKHQGLW